MSFASAEYSVPSVHTSRAPLTKAVDVRSATATRARSTSHSPARAKSTRPARKPLDRLRAAIRTNPMTITAAGPSRGWAAYIATAITMVTIAARSEADSRT